MLAAGRGLWPGGAPGSPALLAHSGGRRWGWGLVTFALRSGLSPSPAPGPRRCLRDCGLPREFGPPCFLTRPAPATESKRHEGLCETSRESATSPQAGGRHQRDWPRRTPSPTRKNLGDGAGLAKHAGVGCGEAVRRRGQELRPGIGAGRIAALECRRPGSSVRRRSQWASRGLSGLPCGVCTRGVLPPVAAPPTSRLLPAA